MVHLKGATGSNAYKIDGLYKPTEELVGNTSVYRKVGDADLKISYNIAQGKWWILGRDKLIAFAFTNAHSPIPLEECPKDCWEVYDGDSDKWVKQTSLTAFQEYELSKVLNIAL